jgi:hypothetical protein
MKMTTIEKIVIFGVFFILGASAMFGIVSGTRGTVSEDLAKDREELRTSLTTLDANVRILTETLTKYEEELKLCRARPFCQDAVAPASFDVAHEKRLIEILEKNAVPEHSASDEVDNANP